MRNISCAFLRRTLFLMFLLTLLALIVGSCVALFLWMVEAVTLYRFTHPYLLYALPAAGVGVAFLYKIWGNGAEGGNNLILEAIHSLEKECPFSMGPLVFIGTVVSHLFGASVGREGTAVQLGAWCSTVFARFFTLTPEIRFILLMSGVAAGFGAVFDTPLAGAVFALEVVVLGRINYRALLPVFYASVLADWITYCWGIHHPPYPLKFAGVPDAAGFIFHTNFGILLKVAVAGICFGLGSRIFSDGLFWGGRLAAKLCPSALWRPFLGGIATIALFFIAGTPVYLGLGVSTPIPHAPSILNFFGDLHYPWSWAWKIIFTLCALCTGFKGGEVTPLFFVGSAIGNALAPLLHLPPDLLAAAGFAAVFGAASNTPFACIFLAIELFGGTNAVYFATACLVAYFVSGSSGIYLSQLVGTPKYGPSLEKAPQTLREYKLARSFWSL